MANPNYMNKSSTRGICLSITLLFSIIIIAIPSNVYAEEVNVKSFAYEETTIIEITNDSNELVNSLRIWLGGDLSFKSFKTEKGWVGEKTPQGVIIFTSSETIKPRPNRHQQAARSRLFGMSLHRGRRSAFCRAGVRG